MYVLVCLVTPLCFLFGVYSDEGMQIQAKLDLLTLTRSGRAYATISCLKNVKM